MAKNQYRTNPTGIQTISRTQVKVAFSRNADGKVCAVTIENVDFSSMGLPADAPVSAILRSPLAEVRIELGFAGALKLPVNFPPTGLDVAGLILRIIVKSPAGPMLLASCENIRPSAVGEFDKSPLLFIEYEELGERMWDLYATNGSGPILRVNKDVDLDLRGAFDSHNPIVRGLVVPQAFEQALVHLACNPTEDPTLWQECWKKYLAIRSIEVPEEPESSEDMKFILEWARNTATVFAHEVRFVTLANAQKQNSTNA